MPVSCATDIRPLFTQVDIDHSGRDALRHAAFAIWPRWRSSATRLVKPSACLSKLSGDRLQGVHPDVVRVVERAIQITTKNFRVQETPARRVSAARREECGRVIIIAAKVERSPWRYRRLHLGSAPLTPSPTITSGDLRLNQECCRR